MRFSAFHYASTHIQLCLLSNVFFLYCIFYGILYMYITKYGCVFLKLGESTYVAMDLIPILLGSLPLAHNAQNSLVSCPAHARKNTSGNIGY